VFFVYPIGASGIDPGRIDFKPEANPSTTPFFEGGLHLSYSRWFYRTRPTLMAPTEASRWPDSIRRFAASRGHRWASFEDTYREPGGLLFEGWQLPGIIGGLHDPGSSDRKYKKSSSLKSPVPVTGGEILGIEPDLSTHCQACHQKGVILFAPVS